MTIGAELDQIAVLAQLQSGVAGTPLHPGQCAHEVTDILEILCGQRVDDLEQGKVEPVIATQQLGAKVRSLAEPVSSTSLISAFTSKALCTTCAVVTNRPVLSMQKAEPSQRTPV